MDKWEHDIAEDFEQAFKDRPVFEQDGIDQIRATVEMFKDYGFSLDDIEFPGIEEPRVDAEESLKATEVINALKEKFLSFVSRALAAVFANTARSALVLAFLAPIVTILVGNVVTIGVSAFAFPFIHPLAFVIEYIMLAAISFLVFGLFSKLSPSFLIMAIPSLILSLVSHYKLLINGEPLLLSDLSLSDSAGEIVAFAIPKLRLNADVVIALIIFAIFFAFLLFFDIKAKLWEPHLTISIASALVLAVAIFSGIASLPYKSLESQEEREEILGTAYGLYCAWNNEFIEELFSSDEISFLGISVNIKNKEATIKPNVIFLMSESFFDVTELDGVSFESDPIPVFHSLEQDYTSGKFVSPVYMGGTGYVEYEVQTAICSKLLKETDTLASLDKSAYETMPCLAKIFSNNGYTTSFLHSYTPELYERPYIYEAFGYDNILFEDSFDETAEWQGGYISDYALSEKIISLFEAREEDQLMMLYAVSMENHQAYTADKFDHKADHSFSCDTLSTEDIDILDSYVCGVEDADEALGVLIDYFSSQEEPVMLVFFGDHLPNLTDGVSSIYERLGISNGNNTTEWVSGDLKKMLETDYVIWTNYGFEAEDRDEGSTMFGLHILDYLNLTLDDYFTWVDENISPIYTMYRPRLYVDGEGNAYSAVPSEYSETFDEYQTIIRDIAYNGDTVFPIKSETGE